MNGLSRSFRASRSEWLIRYSRWAPPMWKDDPSFDLDFHFSRISLPEPGTHAQLLELAQTIGLTPLDGLQGSGSTVELDAGEPRRGAGAGLSVITPNSLLRQKIQSNSRRQRFARIRIRRRHQLQQTRIGEGV